ncbi:hypothetical protein FVEG_12407 [Fusarium verticillioides 7600]|uniref:Uncharacterized protein n=1 Tax=Gibberella moniliformis (strain M3125 / FGSC 7600) TaxID=334819 RepID=W7N1W5_GIBM7|nr:hypothetical protein FVEG_12407 [Fusarium verticillioides 7600]EWG54114.1 hypothetical protein FVEG_12407 [Fusarium verticillioides 7600]
MKEFVLSGDIDDCWWIKGLTAKLYKYKARRTEWKDGALSDEQDTKPKDGKDDEGEDSEDNHENGDDEPAREKIKLNTESFSVEGQPLGDDCFPPLTT